MKQLLLFTGILIFAFACKTQKSAVKIEKEDEVAVTAEDSLEYDVETFDAKFESWYQMHKSPSQYRSKEYYEGWNDRYVSAWNANATDPRKSWFFEPIVGYDPATDYGFELNHELFYYFQYVENVLGISIMEGSPKAVHF